MIGKHSIECTILKDFPQDSTLLGHIELRWVSHCFQNYLGTRGYNLQNFGQDCSVTDYTCPVVLQGSNGEPWEGDQEISWTWLP